MSSRIRLHTLLVVAVVSFKTDSTFAQSTERVSVDSSGAQADARCLSPSISADGRFVAFESLASNLVTGDANGTYDVFVRDRRSGTTERVSVGLGGAEGNSDSKHPAISADGRFVAFWSDASNLVAGDTNTDKDIFVRDRQSGTTERVSVSSSGTQGNQNSEAPSISADGRCVAFYSLAPNLVASDTNGKGDVFVRDRTNGTTERVSVATGGAQGNQISDAPCISADGRFVVFESAASTLIAGDTNGAYDIFVRDRLSGTTERVSVSTGGTQGNHTSALPAISGDGRFVVFESLASSLVALDTNLSFDIFVRDRVNGTTERVSVDSAGAQANTHNWNPAISVDGRLVVFHGPASNLVAGDTNGFSDIFVRNRTSATTERVSVATGGAEGDGDSVGGAMSADGRFVAFVSHAGNLIASDTNAIEDVFLRDRGVPQPVTYCTSSTSSHGCAASIAANANPSASLSNACNITVSSVEGVKFGLLFYGIDNAGFTPNPWAPGSTSLRCVKYPVQRTPVQLSGGTFNTCDGSFLLDWNAYQAASPLALGNPWSVGARVYAQAWFRDPPAAKSTNLSNALELTYLP